MLFKWFNQHAIGPLVAGPLAWTWLQSVAASIVSAITAWMAIQILSKLKDTFWK